MGKELGTVGRKANGMRGCRLRYGLDRDLWDYLIFTYICSIDYYSVGCRWRRLE
ncbi:hypothetical protein HMPREF9134_01004 [Porphyromonas catoniae F0037]|uniref:Uncharacterized protein n=1 Tax=Porphyromonas catoniae F0037 TaxID=1127696 RepID=L1NDD4_9PORP|nr:hypothetical protein HMPREF9134_01004 [Porphyromonas catoniae F0037]